MGFSIFVEMINLRVRAQNSPCTCTRSLRTRRNFKYVERTFRSPVVRRFTRSRPLRFPALRSLPSKSELQSPRLSPRGSNSNRERGGPIPSPVTAVTMRHGPGQPPSVGVSPNPAAAPDRRLAVAALWVLARVRFPTVLRPRNRSSRSSRSSPPGDARRTRSGDMAAAAATAAAPLGVRPAASSRSAFPAGASYVRPRFACERTWRWPCRS